MILTGEQELNRDSALGTQGEEEGKTDLQAAPSSGRILLG